MLHWPSNCVGFQALIQYQSRQSALSAIDALQVGGLMVLACHDSWKLISEFFLIKASKLYNYFVGTKYIWWLLSARYSVFKVSVIILTVFNPAGLIIWEVLSLMFFFFPFSLYLFISLSELQVNYNNERSRCVRNTLTSFCLICNLNWFWLKIHS